MIFTSALLKSLYLVKVNRIVRFKPGAGTGEALPIKDDDEFPIRANSKSGATQQIKKYLRSKRQGCTNWSMGGVQKFGWNVSDYVWAIEEEFLDPNGDKIRIWYGFYNPKEVMDEGLELDEVDKWISGT